MPLLHLQQISIAFGGPPLLEQAQLQIEPGERVFIVGRNGEGKSTLLKLIEGVLEPDEGERIVHPDIRIRSLSQEVPEDLTCRLDHLVLEGVDPALEEWEATQAVEQTLSLMQLDKHATFHTLSGGQKRRALLAKAWVSQPDLLILDEPTNHLDIETILWMEKMLLRFKGSLLCVTHDRAFLQGLATRIVELDRGQLHSWNCAYKTYLKRKEALLEQEAENWAQFDKKLAKEERWIRQGIKARRTRNEGRVRALKKMREERQARRDRVGQAKMTSHEGIQSGRKVITAHQLSYRYEGAPLIEEFNLDILRGDRIGIIGPNGCGKSTLIRLLLKQLEPLKGTVKHGTKLEMAYFDQHRDQIDPKKTVAENLSQEEMLQINGRPKHILSYLQDFLFAPDRARQKASVLSGGERNRLLLAKLFSRPFNLLILDEPTNDLDIETLELLEELLLQYEGTLLLVSHDRAFINHVVTSTLVFEEEGHVGQYAGGYDDWLDQRRSSTPNPSVEKESPSKKRSRKLSNRERDELASLPEKIEQLEAELEQIHQQINDPSFYRNPPDQITALQQRATALPSELERAYNRWQELDES